MATTPWVRKIREAVSWLTVEGYGLNASVGQQTWELATFLAARYRIPLKLFLPLSPGANLVTQISSLTHEFNLDSSLVEFIPLYADGKTSRILRDSQMIASADLLIPISVRPGGAMEKLKTGTSQEIVEDFETPYEAKSQSLVVRIDERKLNPELLTFDEDLLIHWTRSTNRQWPGEKLCDFYGDICSSHVWPRSACRSLGRIMEEVRIRASARHMPRKTPCVSFTALSPIASLRLMKWRSRYREMSFEPYGVGVARSTLKKLGGREVIYTDQLPDDETVWYHQSIGAITDWRTESEYRIKDDLRLAEIGDITLFCRKQSEAERLRECYGVRALPFEI